MVGGIQHIYAANGAVGRPLRPMHSPHRRRRLQLGTRETAQSAAGELADVENERAPILVTSLESSIGSVLALEVQSREMWSE